ncbi:Vacuolar amino acid transporter 2 [Candida viswanathii]|uniref:Vacuolar amino acid transporter 2 n=1 Tax=Candida viswanathii TaxID=5486 RepID=A0A367YG28_9ASCO|nr:Vacuolar amino acid transporter 2 [Candida viswanathii]
MSKTKPSVNGYTSVPQAATLHDPAATHAPEEFELDTLDYEFEFPQRHADAEVAEEDDEDEEEKSGTSTMRMAFMNMANSILGAGIIGQPYAFRNSGLIGGILVMILLTVLIDWTLRLMVKNSILSQTKSYQDTVNYCFGMPGKIILLLAISSFAYGGCMAFCVIIGDTIPHVLKAFIPSSITGAAGVNWLFQRSTIIVLFTTCISFPLSLNRDISKLAKASGFALAGMFIIVVTTIFRGPFSTAEKGEMSVREWTFNSNIFQGISVISFALVCHHNTMFIYQSMKNPSLAKFSKLTHISCAVSMLFCMLMAINGLVNFGDITKGNILNNFKSNDNWINVARFCFGLNMLTTFPLEIFVVRDVLKEIILARKANLDGSTAGLELSTVQHVAITTFLVFSSMSVSLFTCNLGMILELIGATSASLMAYILPPLCYYKLSWDQVEYRLAMPKDKRRFIIYKAIPSIGCILFGFAVMFISSFMTIRNSMHDKSGEDHCIID